MFGARGGGGGGGGGAPYTKFVFERVKRVLELRGVDQG